MRTAMINVRTDPRVKEKVGAGLSLTLGALIGTTIDYAIVPFGPFGNTSQVTVEMVYK